MSASPDDKFLLTGVPGTATNLAAPGYTIGDSSINVTSTSDFPTTTGVIFGIDVAEVVNGEEVRMDGSYCVFAGVVTGASTIGSLELLYGDPQNYAAGALTRVYITISTYHNQRLIEGILAHANQDGTLKTNSVTNTTVIAGANIATAKLASDAGIITAMLADTSVTPAKLQAGTGTSWVWQSYTSTPVNFTLGNGTMAGKYSQIGKTVRFELYIKLGSTSSMGTAPTFTLPVTANARYDFATFPASIAIGQFTNYDVSATSTYWGPIVIASATTFAPTPMRGDFTWVNNPNNTFSATQPAAAYATGDLLWFKGEYEVA